jgi:hypothetical protein
METNADITERAGLAVVAQNAAGKAKNVPAISHEQYRQHVRRWIEHYENDESFQKTLDRHFKEASIITELDLDRAIPIIMSLYCPTGQGKPRDGLCMLRSLLLMTLLKEPSITKWVERTREKPLLAILCGFDPEDVPGIGTYYDFINKIIDGPYRKKLSDETRRSEYNAKRHHRHLKKESEDKKAQRDANQTASQKLADKLLAEADQPRTEDFRKILEDLLVLIGILPSVEAGLIDDLQNLAVTGDGSILQTGASSNGKPTCSCRKEGVSGCSHPKSYTSPTAKWCFDAAHGVYKFGDRYYHLIITQNGRDFPVHTLMPGGNVSDHTLSLESFDRFLKIIEEHGLDMKINIFCGDGHHDTNAHYHYFMEKSVVPIIPLSEKSKNAYPHLLNDGPARLDEDGAPLCPGGSRMRRHQYNKKKKTHVYVTAGRRLPQNGRFKSTPLSP